MITGLTINAHKAVLGGVCDCAPRMFVVVVRVANADGLGDLL